MILLSYSKLIDYLFWKSTPRGIPLSGTFELTARCNLDCKMCYIHKRENDRAALAGELTADQWIDIAEWAQKKQTLLLLLTGGEPLIRKDFRDIYLACRKLGFLISINTNAALIDDDMISFFRDNPPLRFNITLYGASADTYRKLCGNSDAYYKAYYAVKELQKIGMRVKLNYSATPENISDIPAVYDFAKKNDLFIQTATYMFPPVRACENGACSASKRLTAEESGRVKWEYDMYRFPDDQLEARVRHMLDGDELGDRDDCQDVPTEKIRCRAGLTTFWITYNGEIRPCGMMTEPSVDLSKTDYDSAWKTIVAERDRITLPSKCVVCKWKNVCEFCPAIMHAETGSYSEVSDYICDRTRSFISEGRKWLESKQSIQEVK